MKTMDDIIIVSPHGHPIVLSSVEYEIEGDIL
jgi:hypothetical protein